MKHVDHRDLQAPAAFMERPTRTLMRLESAALTSKLPCTILPSKFGLLARRKGVPVSEPPSQPVSVLLSKWRTGDQEALQVLFPLIYQELRRIAHSHLRQERRDHTLQSTALVHEAYLRMMKQGPSDIQNRTHFVAVASRLMRQILVDHARAHRAAKRGHGFKLELSEGMTFEQGPNVDLIALDTAMNELSRLDTQQSQIVELRFFGGLSIEATAEIMGLSPTTVKREWATARAWLKRELGRTEVQ
jgi:RNA polymerase sigma factor (TIGR02999 family)